MKARVLALTIVISAAAMLLLSARPKQTLAQTMLGGPLSGLTTGQLTKFTIGMTEFDLPWDPIHGLGPVYTNTNCNNCHAVPVIGGYNSTDRVTYFGKLNSDGTFNPLTNQGGIVLQPLSVSKFIPNCPVAGEGIPPGANLVTQNLPPPLFGAGLIDAIPDAAIEANAGSKGMGIDGIVNMVTDWNGQSRVGHFGYKAQYASLLYSTGFQFNIEVGITNPVSVMENCPQGNCRIPPTCIKRKDPNDPNGAETIQLFDFESFLAPATPGTGNSNGQALFTSVGCILCHTQSYTTPPNVQIPSDFQGHTQTVQALSNQTVSLYSDLLLHHMGTGLADGFPFGLATGDQFRTTPLWGLSFRTVYLHDGRANNLTMAIQDHSVNADGEAAQVIQNFNALSPQDQADLIAFISSL
jgi:CxxC motif-containing protein (DUF1111 family)